MIIELTDRERQMLRNLIGLEADDIRNGRSEWEYPNSVQAAETADSLFARLTGPQDR